MATLRPIPLLVLVISRQPKGGRPESMSIRTCPLGGPMAEDAGFEPARAVNPTRVPGERHRPLGESSVAMVTEGPMAPASCSSSTPGQVLDSSLDPARRLSCELPQGRKAARVNGLCRVRGVPYLHEWRPASPGFAALV